MIFINSKNFIIKILSSGILVFILLFVNFSFTSLIAKVMAQGLADSSPPPFSPIGLPQPPVLRCPNNFDVENSIWSSIFGDRLNSDSGSVGTFMVCFLFVAGQIFSFLIWLAIVLSILAITYYGILYIVRPGGHSDVTKKIIWAVVGLIVSLLSFTLVQLIRWSLFTFNANLNEISYLLWFINKFQFINFAHAYVEGSSIQSNNLFFGYLGEKLILILSFLASFSSLSLLGLPDWINNLRSLRLSFCPDLPNVFSPSSIANNTWANCALSFIYMLIYLLSWSALVLSVIFIAWFGILYIAQPSEAQKTHSRLKYAFIGLLVSLSAIIIINLISMLFVVLFPS